MIAAGRIDPSGAALDRHVNGDQISGLENRGPIVRDEPEAKRLAEV